LELDMAQRSPHLSITAQINDQRISVAPRETLLQAALRNGIDFPYSCRVGGCATCKCRLTKGKVKELTETGYLLSAEEIDRGTILACQSVPQTDIAVTVELGAVAGRKVAGRVVAQTRLTHDLTQLVAQLDEPLPYRAGQFAQLSIAALPGVSRSYSFATPSREDGLVTFLIRKVPGGEFSSLVDERDLVGQAISVEGPAGQGWLRPSAAPLVFVAGGSGLAPILAILEEALAGGEAAGATRPVTLWFGARTQADLYALAQLRALAAGWLGSFRFFPVLSEEPEGSDWTGAHGLVTEALSGLVAPDAHAYLCGPPGMIDRAVTVLQEQGVASGHIHCDRFFTQHDVVAGEAALSGARAAAAPEGGSVGASVSASVGASVGASAAAAGGAASADVAAVGAGRGSADAPVAARWNVLHYLKYVSFSAIGVGAAAALFAGGPWLSLGLAVFAAIYIVGDALAGDDLSTPRFAHPGILTAQLWLALPLLMLIVFAAIWSISPGDPLHAGALLTRLTGYDLLAARQATWWGHHVSAAVLTGLAIGMIGTIPAHELTHRTWDPISVAVGRWLLAFSFDTSFAIEHVYGHHRYVSTTRDPATAPRGRNVYAHVVFSTIKGNLSAWHIEAERLGKKRLPLLSWHNAVLRGYLMSAALLVVAALLGGWQGAAYFSACALWGKALLEIVNYMEHYGIVRNPEAPVQPRHSWNSNRRISSWAMFNLTRHSHHHAQGEVPFHELRPYPNAPMMINGYLTTLLVAMIPPLWHSLMSPKVLAWDRDFANAEERRLAAAANATSGLRVLQAEAAQPQAQLAARSGAALSS
jgi:NAD(P)H-flavin reductase/ferredoxin/fatty-acid desaturase